MKEIQYTYNNEEQAWISDELTLTGNTLLLVSLLEKGRVVIKKRNADGEEMPKVEVSPVRTDFAYKLTGEDIVGMTIVVATSEEPKILKYVNI